MNLPTALRTRLMDIAPPAGAAGPQQHTIGIPIETQKGKNWCWAAVAVSIRNARFSGPPMQQCELAQIRLGHDDCCIVPLPADCDQTNFLERALTDAGVTADNQQGLLPFPDLCDRIRNDLPVCCAIQWMSGGFHFIEVDGFIAGGTRGNEVIVNDPLNPGGRMTYDTLVRNYGVDTGQWIWTYRVL